MRLNDEKKTLVNIANACWAEPAESKMGSGGPGLSIGFNGGNTWKGFEYKDPEAMDRDLAIIEGIIARLENPQVFLNNPPADGGKR